jgi:acetyltransferase
LGTELLKQLLEFARNEGIERVVAEIMPENSSMRHVAAKLGFGFGHTPDGESILAEIELEPKEHLAILQGAVLQGNVAVVE